jgi:hypothetical protein
VEGTVQEKNIWSGVAHRKIDFFFFWLGYEKTDRDEI